MELDKKLARLTKINAWRWLVCLNTSFVLPELDRLFCLNLIGCALCHYGIEDCRRSVSPVCLLVDKKAGTLGR